MKTSRWAEVAIAAGLASVGSDLSCSWTRVGTTPTVEAPGAFCGVPIDRQGRYHLFLPNPTTKKCEPFDPNSSQVIGEKEPVVFTLTANGAVMDKLLHGCTVLYKQRVSLIATTDKELPCIKQPAVINKVAQMHQLFDGK
jgi:hypothetical protein